MINRLFLNVFILFSILFLPWWITAVLILYAVVVLPLFWESLLWFLAWATVYLDIAEKPMVTFVSLVGLTAFIILINSFIRPKINF